MEINESRRQNTLNLIIGITSLLVAAGSFIVAYVSYNNTQSLTELRNVVRAQNNSNDNLTFALNDLDTTVERLNSQLAAQHSIDSFLGVILKNANRANFLKRRADLRALIVSDDNLAKSVSTLSFKHILQDKNVELEFIKSIRGPIESIIQNQILQESDSVLMMIDKFKVEIDGTAAALEAKDQQILQFIADGKGHTIEDTSVVSKMAFRSESFKQLFDDYFKCSRKLRTFTSDKARELSKPNGY